MNTHKTKRRVDQRLGVMENAINTRLTDVEDNQNVLRIDMDAMDYEFAKMTDSFEHMQKKTDDLEAKLNSWTLSLDGTNSSSLGYLVSSGKHGICVKPK